MELLAAPRLLANSAPVARFGDMCLSLQKARNSSGLRKQVVGSPPRAWRRLLAFGFLLPLIEIERKGVPVIHYFPHERIVLTSVPWCKVWHSCLENAYHGHNNPMPPSSVLGTFRMLIALVWLSGLGVRALARNLNMAGRYQGYHSLPNNNGTIEIFWRADGGGGGHGVLATLPRAHPLDRS